MQLDLRSIPAPEESAAPEFLLTPAILIKITLSLSIMSMGLYYLSSGKETANLRKMALGAALVVASLLIF